MSEPPPHIEPGTNFRTRPWGCNNYPDSDERHMEGPFECLTGCGRNKDTGEDMICKEHPDETRSCLLHTGIHILATAGLHELEENDPAGYKLFVTQFGRPNEMHRWIVWKMEERDKYLEQMEDKKLAAVFRNALDKADIALRYIMTAHIRKTPFRDDKLLTTSPPDKIHTEYKKVKAAQPGPGLINFAHHPHMHQHPHMQ